MMKLKNDKQGSILLFVGPSGTGKTSLGKSIADALSREYVCVSHGDMKETGDIEERMLVPCPGESSRGSNG